MNPNQVLWEKGDFTRIAETMRASGEALVASIGIPTGSEVLDLGCGDGTTAIPAAICSTAAAFSIPPHAVRTISGAAFTTLRSSW